MLEDQGPEFGGIEVGRPKSEEIVSWDKKNIQIAVILNNKTH